MSENKTDQGTQPYSGLGTSEHGTARGWTSKIPPKKPGQIEQLFGNGPSSLLTPELCLGIIWESISWHRTKLCHEQY